MPLFAEFNTSHLFLLGLVLSTGVVLYRTQARMRQANPRSPAASPPAPKASRGHNAAAPPDIKAWEVELHDFARDVSARIDSKMAALEQLIRTAQHETLHLEETIARAEAAGMAQHQPASGNAVDYVRPASQAQALEQFASQAGRGAHVPAPKARLAASRRHAEIYALADAGLDLQQIAERAGTPVGEVELILGLRNS